MVRINIKFSFPVWVLFICFSLLKNGANAQSVKTIVDKKDILIGEQIQYKVKASFPANTFRLHWFSLPDSIPHFDLIEKTSLDSATTDNTVSVEQNITFTSFDSGKWAIPSFLINFDPVVDDTTVNLFTDSILINVRYAPADTSNQLRDIKPIIGVKIIDYFWYYVAGGILLALLIGYLIYRYIKNKRNRPPALFSSKISPYDEAMEELAKLKQRRVSNTDELKYYYTKLAEIFKWYLSRKQGKNLMSSTTYDVLIQLSQNGLNHEQLTPAAVALRTGDAVKFAKYLPIETETGNCFDTIKNTINTIETVKPINE